MKRNNNFTKYFLISFLAIFPFGQIFRFSFPVAGLSVTLLLIDVVSGLFLLQYLYLRRHISLPPFLAYLIFSFFVGFAYFSPQQVFLGGLYLLRVFSYCALFYETRLYLLQNKININLPLSMMSLVSLIIVILGFVQYFFLPDFRGASTFGWDDHLYRLFGSFIDPGFTGIILVLGFISTFHLYINTQKNALLLLIAILIIALLLTYSRASYLGFLVTISMLILFVRMKMKVILIFLTAVFIISIPFLPRPEGEGVRLERTSTIHTRVSNYEETLLMWRESPLVGLGFNTLCFARQNIISTDYSYSHACSGADSSVLLILATTGILGLMIFIYTLWTFAMLAFNTFPGKFIIVSTIAVLINASFINSLFYPWVMGWLAIYGAITVKSKS